MPMKALLALLRSAPHGKLTVDELARCIGRKRTWVYDRLSANARAGRTAQTGPVDGVLEVRESGRDRTSIGCPVVRERWPDRARSGAQCLNAKAPGQRGGRGLDADGPVQRPVLADLWTSTAICQALGMTVGDVIVFKGDSGLGRHV
jgi:hypothetical protein